MAVNYSILADVELNTKSIQQQLNKVKNATLKLKVDSNAGKAAKEVKELDKNIQDTSLSFQAANEIFSKTIDIISSMVEEVYALNAATIEFQKVSDLQGQALENYIGELSMIGDEVARTGKPKCQAPNVGQLALRTSRNPVQPKAYSTTMVA